MPTRVALLVQMAPQPGTARGILQVTHPDTQQTVAVPQLALLLTLTYEPEASFCRGQVTLLHDNTVYPIQSNAHLFAALDQLMNKT